MRSKMSESTFDPLAIETVKPTEWVESITLPIYSHKPNASSQSNKYMLLSHTYMYIKHMMAELELKQNVDYIIVPIMPGSPGGQLTVQVKFRPGREGYASMCVLLWERYKLAKIEKNI